MWSLHSTLHGHGFYRCLAQVLTCEYAVKWKNGRAQKKIIVGTLRHMFNSFLRCYSYMRDGEWFQVILHIVFFMFLNLKITFSDSQNWLISSKLQENFNMYSCCFACWRLWCSRSDVLCRLTKGWFSIKQGYGKTRKLRSMGGEIPHLPRFGFHPAV